MCIGLEGCGCGWVIDRGGSRDEGDVCRRMKMELRIDG